MQERPAMARDPDGSDRIRSPASTTLTMFHDFRNMLQLASSGISIATRLLGRSEQPIASILGDAVKALERANLLALRLGAAGEPAGNAEPLLVQTIVPEFRSLLKRALGPDIQLESLISEDLPAVMCDRLRLENVLLNLAVNARDAINGKGRVIIEAVSCRSRAHPSCVALSVTDTGSGMPPEVAEQAFRPFFTTRLADGGSGIGLYNVRSFAEELGGSAQLSTEPNFGTRILLHLPAIEQAGRD